MYAYAVGPATSTLSLGPFELSRSFAIDFCYYVASYGGKLAVYITRNDQEGRERLYVSDNVNGDKHHWICDKVYLNNGTYEAVEFSAEGLRNEFSYVGLDQIDVFDPLQGLSACEKKSKETTIPL
ncbi:hypothetical protein ANCDUO_01444 [Ancylostoma duodenale]|uniref:MAM domain-containing protein n=1 Tax=Ancylostoma duodenale TaxID=51022 RepID=A0A0C2DE56_9BILA|nr:hypothetical protein ANCDUO_01444 [Ancylostoma duodenale]